MLELFKTLEILGDSDNPALFSELAERISENYGIDKGLRPFVIFYDNKNYWYLKSRDAKYSKEYVHEETRENYLNDFTEKHLKENF